MAYKVVKYRLTAEGTIPTFLKFGVSQGTGGMFPVKDSTASPRDHVMIGIADDGSDYKSCILLQELHQITSKDNLTTYLTSISSGNGWKQIASDGTTEEDFVPVTHATRIWNDLTTLNGG